MQPLARLSHSVAVLEPEETVRGSSRSVVLPNSERGVLVGTSVGGVWRVGSWRTDRLG
jgi:hypothetical protein